MQTSPTRARITSISLDGVGPYSRPTRLELRPFTVLCGMNGSGKSTWLEILAWLSRGLDADDFPFMPLRRQGWTRGKERHVGHLVSMARLIEDPPRAGSVELEFELMDALEGAPIDRPRSIAAISPKFDAWLWDGTAEDRTRFALTVTTGYKPLVALWRSGPGRLAEADFSYSLTVRLPDAAGEVSVHWNAVDSRLDVQIGSKALGTIASGQQNVDYVNRQVTRRLHETLRPIVDGLFHIGAIRDIHARSHSQESLIEVERRARRRHVGLRGEHSHVLLDYYGRSYARPLHPPFARVSEDLELDDEQLFRVACYPLSRSDNVPDALRAWVADQVPAGLRAQWSSIAQQVARDVDAKLVSEGMCGVLPTSPTSSCDAGDPKDIFERISRVKALLTEHPSIEAFRKLGQRCVKALMGARRLGSIRLTEAWSRSIRESGNGELAFLLTCDADRLEELDLRRRNQLLLAHLVSAPMFALERDPTLADEIDRALLELCHDRAGRPAALQLEYDPLAFRFRQVEGVSLRHFSSPTFPPKRHSTPLELSAGFHQALPLVLQATIMRPGETLAIENPEVHLHPALQVRMIEHLIQHVRAGKIVVVETQSDLVVRRLFRAVKEGSMAPEQVGLHFTDLCRVDDGPAESSLTRIPLGPSGEPTGAWPSGFLDEDLEEATEFLASSSREVPSHGGGSDLGPGDVLEADMPDLQRIVRRGHRRPRFEAIREQLLVLWDQGSDHMAFPFPDFGSRRSKDFFREIESESRQLVLDLRSARRLPKSAAPLLVRKVRLRLRDGQLDRLLRVLVSQSQLTEQQRRDILRARHPVPSTRERRERCTHYLADVEAKWDQAQRSWRAREWSAALNRYRQFAESAVSLVEVRWDIDSRRVKRNDLSGRISCLHRLVDDGVVPRAIHDGLIVLQLLGNYGSHAHNDAAHWAQNLARSARVAARAIFAWSRAITRGLGTTRSKE